MANHNANTDLSVTGTVSTTKQGRLIGKLDSLPNTTGYQEGDVLLIGDTFYALEDVDGTLTWTQIELGNASELAVDATLNASSTNVIQNQAVGKLTTTGGTLATVANESGYSSDTTAQLALKGYVDTAVSTNTAVFLGTYDAHDDLGLTVVDETDPTNAEIAAAISTEITFPSGFPTNNDYVFIQLDYGGTGNANEFRRFKFRGATWAYEYTLNNSTFTEAQWDAINSGATTTNISAIAGKLDKMPNTSGQTFAYCVDSNGQTSCALASSSASAWSLVQRGAGGVIVIGTPTADAHAATKKYVDDADAGKLDKVASTSSNPRVYGINTDGTQAVYNMRTAAVANTIAYRDANGVISVGTPTADANAATKKYVDDAGATKQDILTAGDNIVITPTLPTGYTRLESITSSGTQCIDTGVAVDNHNSFEIDFLAHDGANGYLLSQANNSIRQESATITWYSYNANFYTAVSTASRTKVRCGYNFMVVNGTYISGRSDTDSAAGTSVYLLAKNDGTNFLATTVYRFKVYDPTGALIFDGIPAQRTSDDAVGLYDMISGTFKENAGTGAFTAGSTMSGSDTIDTLNVLETTGDLITTWGTNSYNATDDNVASAKLVKDGLDTKVDKITSGSNTIYGYNNATHSQNFNAAYGASAETIPIRDTGGVVSVGTPTADAHAATKKYVDDSLAGYLPLSGGTLTGSLTLTGTNGITSNNIIFNDWKLNVARVASGKLYRYVGIDVDANTGWLKTRSETDVKNDLGINDKVDKSTHPGQGIYLYGNTDSQVQIPCQTEPNQYTVAYRGSGGTVRVGTPTSTDHATTKAYVDSLVASIPAITGTTVNIMEVD